MLSKIRQTLTEKGFAQYESDFLTAWANARFNDEIWTPVALVLTYLSLDVYLGGNILAWQYETLAVVVLAQYILLYDQERHDLARW